MRTIPTIAFTVLASTALAQAPQSTAIVQPENSYTRLSAGPDILSIEEAANLYFSDVADRVALKLPEDDPFNPKNMLRERYGLTQAQTDEVISVARGFTAASQAGKTPAAIEAGTAKNRSFCQSLNKAATADAQLAVLEAAEAANIQNEVQAGRAFLDQLSPATRARVRQMLIEYRKSLTVGRQDWKKLRDTKPEGLEMYRAAKCHNVN